MRILFISFSSLKTVARIPRTSSDECGHIVLMLILKEIFFSFSLLTIMFTMVLSHLAFIMLRYVPPMTTLVEVCFSFFFIKTLNFVEFKFEFWGFSLQIICVSSSCCCHFPVVDIWSNNTVIRKYAWKYYNLLKFIKVRCDLTLDVICPKIIFLLHLRKRRQKGEEGEICSFAVGWPPQGVDINYLKLV